MGKRGGPKKELDPNLIRRFGTKCFNLAALAEALSVDPKTLQARLADSPEAAAAWASCVTNRRNALIRGQWEQALGSIRFAELSGEAPAMETVTLKDGTTVERERQKPVPIMAIWLAKNELGWSDKGLVEGDFAGDLAKIGDEQLFDLIVEILRKRGKATSDLERALKAPKPGKAKSSADDEDEPPEHDA